MRKLDHADVDFYHRLTGDLEVMRWITGKAHTEVQSHGEVERLVKRYAGDPVHGIWVFSAPDHEGPVGVGALTPHDAGDVEIGYRVLRSLWGRGLGTAIARELIGRATHSPPRGFIARVTEGNVASQRILEKLGFRQYARAANQIGSHDIVLRRDP
jgi:RimJ/RimL family protein N-acetyltransferase